MAGGGPHVSEFETDPRTQPLPNCGTALRTKGRYWCTSLQDQDHDLMRILKGRPGRRAAPSRNGWSLQGCWHVGWRGQGVMA